MLLNRSALAYQVLIFSIQWALMIIGLGILAYGVVPVKFLEPGVPFGRFLDAGIKALVALGLSVFWLYLWDRQVRFLFRRR
jgi:hypothetical protein